MNKAIVNSLTEAQNALNQLLESEETLSAMEEAAKVMIESLENGGTLFSCGNGGSMCDATHFAEELTGRYRKDRRPYPALSINDSSHMSCVSNDYGYDEIFSRYLEAHGRKGDCLIALSTSGKSPNVVKAAEVAQTKGMKVIVLSGKVAQPLEALAEVYISTPAGGFADRVQELHIKVLHIFIELIERHFHPENYLQ